jgi:hypothetical protein
MKKEKPEIKIVLKKDGKPYMSVMGGKYKLIMDKVMSVESFTDMCECVQAVTCKTK